MEIKDITSLLASIDLEYVEENIFKGQNHDIGIRHVFGGQVLSQALQAATLTVPLDRVVHSLHAYFILPGDLSKPIIYLVDRVRDGGSFTTRRVRAIQNGKDIFITAVSFQLEQEGLDHQMPIPEVRPPEELQSDQVLLKQYIDHLPPGFEGFLTPRPIEFRPINPMDFILPEKKDPVRYVWMKAKGPVPNNPLVHQRILAYASDYNLLTTALLPHQHKVNYTQLQWASLDHAMWFHRKCNIEDWLLYALDSPSASGARGFSRGSIYNRSGELVASVVQEGLMRKKRKK